ncbi:ABC transporter permease [Cnuibacter physcomitrellae]|uniref:Glycine/betaine ABC transporter permease n=1 Tax=Cnuibacter physcomitrellae TaxID=1619308 RepID=A0A1X9LKC0_9MICO|nr:ABC transporter permease subunit [Cnuibacter physcomitrellae]ARJ04922.1 glycine/betaine ABC transporter permease [Cnuibacter physcomitrellae]GGI41568.1 ABC transporter permease [Cnuibacter physcomitrellae]
MSLFGDAIGWLLDPANWQGPQGIGARLIEQLAYTFGAVLIALVIALPLGILIGHTGKGRDVAVALSGGLRALPSLGLLILIALGLGIGFRAPLITFVILAIPPVLAGTYAGIEAVDRKTVDAARAMGMTEWQIITRVELPLGLPLLIGGIRSGVLQVVATATLAAYVTGGALGSFIYLGYSTRNYTIMLGASILVTLLAIVLELLLSLVQRLVVPRGVVAGTAENVRERPTRLRPVMGTPIQEGK